MYEYPLYWELSIYMCIIFVCSIFIRAMLCVWHVIILVGAVFRSGAVGVRVQCHSGHGYRIMYPLFAYCDGIRRYRYEFEWPEGFQQ